MKPKKVIILIVMFILVALVTLFIKDQVLYSLFISKPWDKDVLNSIGCPLDDYDYKVENGYPLFVTSRIVDGKEQLNFPDLPTEDEFLRKARISSEDAITTINDKIIYFTNSYIPRATAYNYKISRDNIQSVNLTTLRYDFCNSQHRGTYSAIRVVWQIIMQRSQCQIGVVPYDCNWNVFVDAVTGEVVRVSDVQASEVIKKKPIPPWYSE